MEIWHLTYGIAKTPFTFIFEQRGGPSLWGPVDVILKCAMGGATQMEIESTSPKEHGGSERCFFG